MSIRMADIQAAMMEGASTRLTAMGYPPDVVAARVRALVARPLLPAMANGRESQEWLEADTIRRGRHRARRACWEADITLDRDASAYLGDWGRIVDEAVITSRYAPGEDGERHQRLRQIAKTSYHFMRRVTRAMRVVRKVPLGVDRQTSASPSWETLRAESGLDDALEGCEALAIATGACGVGVAVEPGFEPRAVVVPGDRLSAWRGVTVEHAQGQIIVCDLREPAWPILRVYAGHLTAGIYLRDPDVSMEGPAYPIVDAAGLPVPRVQVYTGITPDAAPMPVEPCLFEGTLEIFDLRLQAEWFSRVGLFERIVVAGEVKEVAVAELDPAVVIGLKDIKEDGRAALIAKLEAAPKSFAAWDQKIAREIATLASQFYDGLVVEVGTREAESGYAIELRQDDVRQLHGMLVRRWRLRDAGIIQALVGLHNGAVMRGELPGAEMVDASDLVLRYEPARTPRDKAERRAAMREEIAEGLGTVTPVDILCDEESADPESPDARASAMERLARNAREIEMLRSLGLLTDAAVDLSPTAEPAAPDEGGSTDTPPEATDAQDGEDA